VKQVVEVSSYGGYKLMVSNEWIEVVAPNGDTITVRTMSQARRWIKTHRKNERRRDA
jgi:ASC-1-like (ASCH) protein